MKIDNKEFLKYLTDKCLFNLTFIKSIRFNKKSISIKCDNGYPIFNDFFTKEFLYGLIIEFLRLYIMENDIDHTTNRDFLEYKYQKLNVL